jgi:hypothetical protein
LAAPDKTKSITYEPKNSQTPPFRQRIREVGLDIEPARAAVRTVLKAFGGRQLFRKVLIETLIARGMSEELSRPVELVAQAVAGRLREGAYEVVSDISPVRLFVLTRAVVGVIRPAVMEQSEFLDTQILEDEFVALVQTYFLSFAPRS